MKINHNKFISIYLPLVFLFPAIILMVSDEANALRPIAMQLSNPNSAASGYNVSVATEQLEKTVMWDKKDFYNRLERGGETVEDETQLENGHTLISHTDYSPNKIDRGNKTIRLGQGGVIATDSRYKLSTGKDTLRGCTMVIIKAFVQGRQCAYAATHILHTEYTEYVKDKLVEIGDMSDLGKIDIDPNHPIQRAINLLGQFVPDDDSVQYKAIVIGISKRGNPGIIRKGLEQIWKIDIHNNGCYIAPDSVDLISVLYNGDNEVCLENMRLIDERFGIYEAFEVVRLTWQFKNIQAMTGLKHQGQTLGAVEKLPCLSTESTMGLPYSKVIDKINQAA